MQRLLLVLLLVGCGLPRDPQKTLERVRGKVLTVGVAEDPPFLVRQGQEASGIEAEAIRGFANSLNASVKWVWGAPEKQLAALEKCELDLVAGGIDAKTPWAKKVAVTRPYLEVIDVVACKRGAPAPGTLEHEEVAVEEGDPVAAEVEKEKANVHRVEHIDGSQPLVAGSKTKLLPLGYTAFKELKREKRSLAAPPGENAFLQALEKYLAGGK